MSSYELDPVERITAGAVGEPGERTFFVQAEAAGATVTFLAEKEQVRMLAQAMQQLLDQLPAAAEDTPPEPASLILAGPLEPDWRVGEMSIEFDEERDRIAVVLSELVQVSDDEPDVAGATARLVATRAQIRAMADHALEVVDSGRPRCQLCGYPMGPRGDHVCPARNGHGAPRG